MTEDDPDAEHYSEQAVKDLMDRYGEKALAVVTRRGFKRADAEPIIQEAFLEVIKSWRRSEALVQPQCLLFATVRKRLANEFRRQGRKPVSLVDSDESIAATADTLWQRQFTEVMAVQLDVARALLDLPHRQRAVLTLRFMDDLEIEIVAELLGCKPGVVTYAQKKGIENIKKSRWLTGHAGTAEVNQ